MFGACAELCLVNSCCCGKELNDGAFVWAIVDLVGHALLLPLPQLMADLNSYSPYFICWILLIMFSDAVLILGTKSGKPAFMTFWLIMVGINIVALTALIVVTFVGEIPSFFSILKFERHFLTTFLKHYVQADSW